MRVCPEMVANHGWKILFFGCFAFWSIIDLAANAASTPKLDRAWKRYFNSQWGYCVSYPARWRKGDAFEGAGMFVAIGMQKQSNPLGEIDITALPDRSANPQLNFIDIIQVHLDGLKKFQRAQQMELLDQRTMNLSDSPALFAKERYYDPLERTRWVEEIVFAERQNALYRLELECRADQLTRFEPVFAHVVSTFQFDCPEKRKLTLGAERH
jgi:hypothetical protein